MKVVINDCFGGFNLSPAGERAYLARKGKEAFFYIPDRSGGVNILERDYIRVSEEEARDAFMFMTVTRDLGERVTHEEFWPKGKWYWNDRDLNRADPDLVAVVEEMGNDAAGSCASLAVVEIPDDVDWVIEEYDGLEHVAEAHRTWTT